MLQNLLNHISWSNNSIVNTGAADADTYQATSGMLGCEPSWLMCSERYKQWLIKPGEAGRAPGV